MRPGRTQDTALNRLLSGYKPLPGVADELMDASGRPRPAWLPLMSHLAAMTEAQRDAAFARADRYLRDAGVFYRLYADTGAVERDWPLSHLPVVIDEAEWAAISDGLIQRAGLLEQVVADLYGPARLVREGHLPAGLIAACPEWLRPLVGVQPASGHFLHLVAFEIGRSPDGSWFVLGDRTQAPSGAGFALETRMATSRAYGQFYPGAGVHRLADWFRSLRAMLEGLRLSRDGGVGILTPGPLNDTYFEHAWVARYLGLTLLEGEDLALAEDGGLTIRTVAGPRPVDVLWRRLDAGFADPLELDPESALGTPGLVAAIRAGRVTMVNALGSGVLEARALMAFLPRLAEVLLGESLRLPNIATWWCGQPEAAAEVAARLAADPAALVIASAQSTRLAFDREASPAPPEGMSPADWLASAGAGLVAQERVTISTAPAMTAQGLAPRPMSLRAFALRSPDGWRILPGGFARLGRSDDPTAIALQSGGTVADVWITGPGSVPVTGQSLASGASGGPAYHPGALPARAADNLFWLGRYVERSEHGLRLMRAYHLRLAEEGAADRPLLTALAAHLAAQGIDPACPPAALAPRIGAARACAAKLRDRLSTDAWMALEELARSAAGLEVEPGEEAARALAGVLPRIAAFSGLVQDNMQRATGWQFLTLGRSIERADAIAWTLAVFADPAAPEGGLDLAVELGDSVLTHRQRHGVEINRDSVVELLALEPDNPRALRFQLAKIESGLERLPPPGNSDPRRMTPAARLARLRHTDLAIAEASALDSDALMALRRDISVLSDRIAASWFH